MNSLSSSRRLAPSAPVFGALTAVLIGGWCLAPEVHSQAAAAATSNAALVGPLAKLKAQQAQIVANQTKIEAQTALLKEELRQSKIYSARGGAGRR